MNKGGLSGVVTALLLVLLAIAMVGIVWAVVTNLIERETSKTSCIDTVGKVNLNHQYVCYNSSDASKELKFAISIGDIDIDSVTVSVSGGGIQKSFKILNQNSTINYLKIYNRTYQDVILPEKNGGLSYVYNMSAAGFSGWPDSLEIFPQIGDNTCSATDRATEIVACYTLD